MTTPPGFAVRLFATRALALLLAAGCTSVGPDYVPPKTPVPPAWREDAGAQLAQRPADLAAWWRHLDDPVLSRLVAQAQSQGLDLREALWRVREARALRGIAASEHWPSLDAELAYVRRGESENTPLGPFATDSNRFTAGFDAAWEIDLWGRVRRSVEAAQADLEATVEDTRLVLVTVAAETAVSYVELRTFQRRLAIARANVQLQEQTLALVRGRFDSGLVGERDVAQARTNVETTRARVPALEVGLRAAENRLAVLLGLPPGALAEELAAPAPIPVPPLAIAVGVPADLLRRRADVRRAERELAAATARIGVAEGDLYPRLTLLGSIGLEADDFSDLLESQSGVFAFGPSLRWNLFAGGALRRRVEAQEARTQQAAVRCERAVLTSLEESENAMTAFVREQLRRRSLAAAVEGARLSVQLARTQYTEGLADFQPVLDSERALADLEDQLAQSDAAITTSAVRLYKALGGGWEHAPDPRLAAGDAPRRG